jgi:hypothetical protein
MARYPTPHTFNTGSLAAATAGTFNRSIGISQFNIMKIKVVPSAVSVGYKMEIFKKDTYLAADLLFATIDNVNGNLYIPTDKSGNEVLEGFVVPYEDLDVSGELHIRITNQDAVARTYQVTVTYEAVIPTAPSFTGLSVLSGGNLSFYASTSGPQAVVGQIRGQHGFSMYATDFAGTSSIPLLSWGWGDAAQNELCIGSPGKHTKISTNLAAPSSPGNGEWWVECVGTTPSRVCAIKVRDGGTSRTIASITV